MSPNDLRPEDLRFDPPTLPFEVISAVVAERFELDGDLSTLRGERDQNLLLTESDGTQWVVKVASPSEDPATVDFHCKALEHLALVAADLGVPRVRRSVNDLAIESLEVDGLSHQLRVLSFLPGITFDEAGEVSDTGVEGIGAFQGQMTAALARFQHPAAANFMPWALDSGMLTNDTLWSGLGSDSAVLAEPARARVERACAWMATARKQVIHNDAHRGNLIRPDEQSEEVVGVIDFGDLVETALVADLGISGASLAAGAPDPIASFAALVRGFNTHFPLLDEELDHLSEMVLCRLVLSTLMVDYQIAHSPHIAAAVSAERPELLWSLEQWSGLGRGAIADRLRKEI